MSELRKGWNGVETTKRSESSEQNGECELREWWCGESSGNGESLDSEMEW